MSYNSIFFYVSNWAHPALPGHLIFDCTLKFIATAVNRGYRNCLILRLYNWDPDLCFWMSTIYCGWDFLITHVSVDVEIKEWCRKEQISKATDCLRHRCNVHQHQIDDRCLPNSVSQLSMSLAKCLMVRAKINAWNTTGVYHLTRYNGQSVHGSSIAIISDPIVLWVIYRH